MKFQEFSERFKSYPVIQVREIEKAYPGFDRNALTRWQSQGYLVKIRRGYYRLASNPVRTDAERFLISNKIYTPSYISLHSALHWYGFIPEGVFMTTAMSTKKTATFDTPFGVFRYSNLQRSFFFGYTLVPAGEFHFKIAEPEKAILDFLNASTIKTREEIEGFRFNFIEIEEHINWDKLYRYLAIFGSRILEHRVALLRELYLKQSGLAPHLLRNEKH